jgi:hypothetical protein
MRASSSRQNAHRQVRPPHQGQPPWQGKPLVQGLAATDYTFGQTCPARVFPVLPCSSRSRGAIVSQLRSSTGTRSNSRRLRAFYSRRTGYRLATMHLRRSLTVGSSCLSQNVFVMWRGETPRHMLHARLCAPRELSGALNKALDGLERVRRRCWFTESKESRIKVKRYQSANDAMAAWLDEHTVASQDVEVPQSELHAAYTSACRQSSRRPASKQLFGRRLQMLRPQIEMAQRSRDGRRVWVYIGIDLRDRVSDPEALT